jgi:hypothetical protein
MDANLNSYLLLSCPELSEARNRFLADRAASLRLLLLSFHALYQQLSPE